MTDTGHDPPGGASVGGRPDPLAGVPADPDAARAALAATVQELRTLTEHITDVVTRTAPDHTIEWVSSSVTTVLGWRPEEVLGHRYDEFWHEADLPVMVAATRQARDGEAIRFRARARAKDGTYHWMEVAGRAVLDGDGRPLHAITVGRHIEDQVRAEKALADSEERFRLLAESTSDVITQTSVDGTIEYASPSLTTVLGWQPRDWIGTSFLTWWHPEDQPGAIARRAAARAGRPARFRGRVRRLDGTYRWVEVDGRVIRDAAGTATGQATVMRDIEEEVRAVEALAHQATHDRLTGLLNREQLTERLRRSLHHRPRTGTRLAILFCDIDNLKTVNDTHGHAVGDSVIVAVGEAITRSIRASDTVARVGGDEFVVVLVGVRNADDAVRLAREVRAAANRTVTVGTIDVRPTLSIGVTVARSGQDVDDVLREADAAMYDAKRAGRDRVVLADSQDTGP